MEKKLISVNYVCDNSYCVVALSAIAERFSKRTSSVFDVNVDMESRSVGILTDSDGLEDFKVIVRNNISGWRYNLNSVE